MVAVVLLVLVSGALIAAIWGRETAQGCFRTIGWSILGLLAVGVAIAVPPAAALAVGCVVFYYFVKLCFYIGSLSQAASERDVAKATEIISKVKQSAQGPQQAQGHKVTDGYGQVEAYRYYPRRGAPTAPPDVSADAEFWAAPVREQGSLVYLVSERRSGDYAFVPPSDFARDWIRWIPESAPPTQSGPPQPEALWQSPSKPRVQNASKSS